MNKIFWKNVVWENDRLIYKRKTNREVTKGRRKKTKANEVKPVGYLKLKRTTARQKLRNKTV